MLIDFLRDYFTDDDHYEFFKTMIEKEKVSVDDSIF